MFHPAPFRQTRARRARSASSSARSGARSSASGARSWPWSSARCCSRRPCSPSWASCVSGQARKARTQTYAVGVVSAAPSRPAETCSRPPRLRFLPATRADAEARIGTHRLDAAVVLPPDLNARLAAGGAAPVRSWKTPGTRTRRRPPPACAPSLTRRAGGDARRLAARGLPPGFAAPFAVTETPIKSGGSVGDCWSCRAAALPADHLGLQRDDLRRLRPGGRGEGARDTGNAAGLAGLAPGHRAGEVRGHRGRLPAQQRPVDGGHGDSRSAAACTPSRFWRRAGCGWAGRRPGVIVLALLPLSVLFAGMLLAVSTYARNQKEAQTLLGPLFTLVLVPAVMSMTISADSRPVPGAGAGAERLADHQAGPGRQLRPGFIALAFPHRSSTPPPPCSSPRACSRTRAY